MTRPFRLIVAVALLFSLTLARPVTAADLQAADVYALLQQAIDDGSVAGGQVAIGQAEAPLVLKSFGVCDCRSRRPVDDDTRFCIGSCSKMFAAAVLVSLAGDKTVDLNAPIDRWLPEFSKPKLLGGGEASRAPTLSELLCHRGGIYSQRNRMTARQTRWIRDFKLSLADSVTGIAAEPLNAEPGEEFAYSGAGYCVLGRVAEVAADKPLDELLALRVCKPLGLSRTSYFPPVDDKNIAAGHAVQDGKLQVEPQTPHLLHKQHRLALVGGSIYAPAREAAEFARMLLHKGKANDREILSPAEWREMTALHSPRPGGGYGFGLVVTVDQETHEVQTLSHGGALFGSFSHIAIDLHTRRFAAVTYTGQPNAVIGETLQRWVSSGDAVRKKGS